jgi:two-component SAPR family response regulator
MKKRVYLGLVFIVFTGFLSTVSYAEMTLPLQPEHIVKSTNHQNSAALHKKNAAYHKAMVAHYKALIAAEYGSPDYYELKNHYETMATHHQALSNEHNDAAVTHEKY